MKLVSILFLLNFCWNNYVLCDSKIEKEICGGTFSGYQYMINSPNYPSNYPENQDCFYFLQGTRMARCEQEFHLQFLDFDIAASENCENDFLQIGEWNIYCGKPTGLRIFKGLNNILKIHFRSKNDQGGKGFRILVTTLPCVTFPVSKNSSSTTREFFPRQISTSQKSETSTRLSIEGRIKKNSTFQKMKSTPAPITEKNVVETLSPVYRSRVTFPPENNFPKPKNFSSEEGLKKLGPFTYLFLPPSSDTKKVSQFPGNSSSEILLPVYQNIPFRSSSDFKLSQNSIKPIPDLTVPIFPNIPFRQLQNSEKLTGQGQRLSEEFFKGKKENNFPDRNFQDNNGIKTDHFHVFGTGIGSLSGSGNRSEINLGNRLGIFPGIGTGNDVGVGSGTGSGNIPGIGSGIYPGIGSGNYPGISSGYLPGIGTGNNPGIGSGNNPGTDSGYVPGISSGINPGNSPGISSGNYPGIGSGNYPGIGSGNYPEIGSGNYPGIGSGNYPGISSGYLPGIGTGNNPGIGSGNNPGTDSGYVPGIGSGINPGNSPEISSGNYPGIGSGNYPGISSGNYPGQSSGYVPGIGSGNNPGINSGYVPGIGSGNNPGINSGYVPGINSGNNPGINSGCNPGIDSENNRGTNSGFFPGISSGNYPGIDSGINSGTFSQVNPENSLGTKIDISSGSDVGFGSGNVPGIGSGIFPGVNSGIIPGGGLGTDVGIGTGNDVGIGSGNRPGFSSGIIPGIGSGNIPGIGSGNIPGIGSGNIPGIGSGNIPNLGEFPIPGSGTLPGIGSGNDVGIGSGIGPGISPGLNPNYPPNSPGWSRPLPECCNPPFPSQKSLISSPGFPTLFFSPSPYECSYKINKFSASVCQLRLNFKFFNFGTEDPFCTNGFLEVDNRRICGCKTGLSLVFPLGNFPGKSINVRYLGFPKSKFNGFLIEIIQEVCGEFPLIRNRKDLTGLNETDLEKFENSSKSIISHARRRREGYEYPRPTGHAIFDAQLGGGRSENFLWNSCQSRTFFDWILAAKEAFISGARCPGAGNSGGLISVIPTPGGWHQFPGNCEEIAAVEGVISSPFYPNYYPNNLRKCYRFYRAPGFCQLDLSVLDLNLEPNLGCTKDYLLFGGQNKRYCGNSLSGTTTVFDLRRSKVAEIYFVTDATGSGRGFTAGFVQRTC